jgi:hypothetical protein
MSRGNIYLFQKAFFYTVDSSGRSWGRLNPDGPNTPPLTSHAYELRGPISMTPPQGSMARSIFRGGGQLEGSAFMGLNELNEGSFGLSQADADAIALMSGSLVDSTSLTGAKIFSNNPLRPTPMVGGLLFGAQFQRRDSTATDWWWLNYPLVTGKLDVGGLTQEAGTNPVPVTCTFTPSASGYFPNGRPFGSAQGWYNNQTFEYAITTRKGLALSTFIADGVATSFIVGYRPSYNDVTGGNTQNWFARNGNALVPTSFNTTTGVVVMPTTGAANDVNVVLYQTDYLAI